MDILLINPNTTASMTDKIGAAARLVAGAGVKVTALNPAMGPASIEGHYDGALAVPGLLQVLRDNPADACIIACFDDTGLAAARCASAAPVIGIGEAAFHLASLIATRFSVVTTLSRAIPVIEANLRDYGLATRCARVRASDVPVLELEIPGSTARERISAEIERALAEDGAEAIVLGCAGMADLAAELSQRHGVPVVDGVASAVQLAQSLARLGLRTSKRGGYAAPLAKPYLGPLADLAPR